jgi:hypothetical protein
MFAAGIRAGSVLEKAVTPRSARMPILNLRWRGRLRYGVKPHRGAELADLQNAVSPGIDQR